MHPSEIQKQTVGTVVWGHLDGVEKIRFDVAMSDGEAMRFVQEPANSTYDELDLITIATDDRVIRIPVKGKHNGGMFRGTIIHHYSEPRDPTNPRHRENGPSGDTALTLILRGISDLIQTGTEELGDFRIELQIRGGEIRIQRLGIGKRATEVDGLFWQNPEILANNGMPLRELTNQTVTLDATNVQTVFEKHFVIVSKDAKGGWNTAQGPRALDNRATLYFAPTGKIQQNKEYLLTLGCICSFDPAEDPESWNRIAVHLDGFSAPLQLATDHLDQRIVLIQTAHVTGDGDRVRRVVGGIGWHFERSNLGDFWNASVAESVRLSTRNQLGVAGTTIVPSLPAKSSGTQKAQDFTFGVIVGTNDKKLKVLWPAFEKKDFEMSVSQVTSTINESIWVKATVVPPQAPSDSIPGSVDQKVGQISESTVEKKSTPEEIKQFFEGLKSLPKPDGTTWHRVKDSTETAFLALEERSQFVFDLHDMRAVQNAWVRNGSLDVQLAIEAQAASDKKTVLTDKKTVPADWSGRIRVSASGKSQALPQIIAEFKYNLPLTRIRPGAEDSALRDELADPESQLIARTKEERTRDDEIDEKLSREPALVIPFPDGANTKRWLKWTITESTRENRVRSIQQTIASVDGDERPDSTRERTIILDRDPFLVAVVSYPPLHPSRLDRDNIFASWDEVNSVWRLDGGDNSQFDLILPPQAVGEEMLKGRNLKDGADAAILDHRFGPTAKLTLRASILDRKFVTAPWNLRAILGNAGEETPGAVIEQIDYELLYGLSCRVDHPYLRLAEISSRIGALPRRVPRRPAYSMLKEIEDKRGLRMNRWNDYREQWADIAFRYRGHLALLEPWSEANRSILPTVSPSCVVRIDTGTDAATDAQLKSVGATNLAVTKNQFASTATSNTNAPQFKAPLQGGALWGVESPAVYRAITRNPVSSSAVLADAGFSALGGYGFQKASFDNDLSAIYAHVSMGRTYDYAVERIGRIGVFWNVAKHVIQYQRAVVPTDQFKDLQTGMAGRPVLRKTNEYIEVLQSTRSYPEFGESPVMRGFVTGCSFPVGTRIKVDSAWGNDIGDDGWQIPLYNPVPRADVQQAVHDTIYPKPDIFVLTRTERDGKPFDIPSRIENPENLIFYTRTSEGTERDTDKWPPMVGIDYAPIDELKVPVESWSGNPEVHGPDPTSAPAELSRFTFRISPAEPVNVVAERTDRAIRAEISSVSMMRKPLEQFRNDASSRVTEAVTLVSAFDGYISAVNRPIVSYERAFRKTLAAALPELPKATESPVKGATVSLKAVRGLIKELDDELSKALALVNGTIALAPTEMGAANGAIDSEARRTRQLVLNQGKQSLARFNQLIKSDAGSLTREQVQWLQVAEDAKILLGQERVALQDVERRKKLIAHFFSEEALGQFQRLGTTPDPLARASRIARDAAKKLNVALSKWSIKKETIEADIAKMQDILWTSGAALDLLNKQRTASMPSPAIVLERVLQPLAMVVHLSIQTLSLLKPWDKAFKDWETQHPMPGGGSSSALPGLPTSFRPGKEAAIAAVIEQIRTAVKEFATTVEQLDSDQWKGLLENRVEKFFTDASAGFDLTSPDFNQFKENFELYIKADGELQNRWAAMKADVEKNAEELALQIWSDNDNNFARKVLLETHSAQLEFASILQTWTKTLILLEDEKWIDSIFLPNPDDISRSINSLKRQLQSQVDGARTRIEGEAQEAVTRAGASVARSLQLFHAFGKPPELPDLSFPDRKNIEYIFRKIGGAVDVTPMVADLSRIQRNAKDTIDVAKKSAANAIQGLGLRVPTRQLLDRCIPAELQNFNVSGVLQDFAGLPLRGLFAGVKLPSAANDAIHVRHGEDLQSKRAWVEAEVKPFAFSPGTLFNIGPLALSLPLATFNALMRASIGADGRSERSTTASIKGDWSVTLAGKKLIRIRDTAIEFTESGKVHFAIKPKDVVLEGAMQFITDLLQSLVPSKSGLTITLLPNGVECILDLPMPNLGGGTTSIANLHLGARFGITFDDKGVTIIVGLLLARKTAPFALTIFILGGGGYAEIGARYTIGDGAPKCRAEVAVNANARLAIELGPISGGVGVYLGIAVSFEQGSGVHFAVNLLIEGHVSVLGIIDAGIWLLLELVYGGGELVGRGTLHMHFKVCWCFTIEIDESVEYRLGCDAMPKGNTPALRDCISDDRLALYSRQYVSLLS